VVLPVLLFAGCYTQVGVINNGKERSTTDYSYQQNNDNVESYGNNEDSGYSQDDRNVTINNYNIGLAPHRRFFSYYSPSRTFDYYYDNMFNNDIYNNYNSSWIYNPYIDYGYYNPFWGNSWGWNSPYYYPGWWGYGGYGHGWGHHHGHHGGYYGITISYPISTKPDRSKETTGIRNIGERTTTTKIDIPNSSNGVIVRQNDKKNNVRQQNGGQGNQISNTNKTEIIKRGSSNSESTNSNRSNNIRNVNNQNGQNVRQENRKQQDNPVRENRYKGTDSQQQNNSQQQSTGAQKQNSNNDNKSNSVRRGR